MKLKEIREIAQKYTSEYDYVAIRTQDQEFEIGTISHNSKVWIDGEETDLDLDGISATDINSDMISMHSEEYTTYTGYYPGEHMAVVAGNVATRGEDDGEIIIEDAVVVEIIK